MSASDDAYRAAKAAIAEAKRERERSLSFARGAFLALGRLPPEIAELTGLERLNLANTQVSDLAPLAALTGLQGLYFDNTQVSDLAPLATLTGLQVLRLTNTQVSDLAPLADLIRLRRLDLDDTQVSDLAPLTALTGLQHLDLENTQVSDLAPLAALTGLQVLYLGKTQVSDLAPLAALTGLRDLRLENTQVSDLAPLAALTGLLRLDLENTQVSDLAPLAALTGLQSLQLTNTQVSDWAPLAALTGLKYLYLTNTKVSDLTPLAALTGLQGLNLDNTQVSALAPLAALTGLQGLKLDNTQVSGLVPLAALTGLQGLRISNTQVSDLAPLAALTGLQSLDLRNTQVSDLRPLRGLSGLAGSDPIAGIWFDGIPACADPQIASIAALANEKDRASALLALLNQGGEPPKNATPVALDPDPILQSLLIDGQLEISPDPPTEEERRDRIKQALHDRLKVKSAALATAAGNEFPLLSRQARALFDLLNRDFSELDILTLHIEIEDLNARREDGTEEGQPYSVEVRQAIGDVTRIGPGLTVDHPSVDIVLERVRKVRDKVTPEADEAAHQALSRAVIEDPAANGPNSRAMEELLERVADKAVGKVLQEAKHKNLIWTIATLGGEFGLRTASTVAGGLILAHFGPEISAFIAHNYGLLSEVAATYGQGVLVWFQQSVGPLIAGIDTTAIRPVNRTKK